MTGNFELELGRQDIKGRGFKLPACHLCETSIEERFVLRGLATLGIQYPGPARFICDACIQKVKMA